MGGSLENVSAIEPYDAGIESLTAKCLFHTATDVGESNPVFPTGHPISSHNAVELSMRRYLNFWVYDHCLSGPQYRFGNVLGDELTLTNIQSVLNCVSLGGTGQKDGA